MRLIEAPAMAADVRVRGEIIDSWLEPAFPSSLDEAILVLQVAPRGRGRGPARELTIVEASAGLLPDPGWIEDLRSNLCHGSLVSARGRWKGSGSLSAVELDLDR